MPNFDWKSALVTAITQEGGTISSSTDTSVAFAFKNEYKFDFGSGSINLSKIDGTFISRLPKILPIFNAVIKTVLNRLK